MSTATFYAHYERTTAGEQVFSLCTADGDYHGEVTRHGNDAIGDVVRHRFGGSITDVEVGQYRVGGRPSTVTLRFDYADGFSRHE